MNRLKLKQKEAIKIISNAGYIDHTNRLFKQQGILSLDDLIKFMHKFVHGRLPFSFNELFRQMLVCKQTLLFQCKEKFFKMPTSHLQLIHKRQEQKFLLPQANTFKKLIIALD
jgi:hypothetical protein